jgi:hypothetical protein
VTQCLVSFSPFIFHLEGARFQSLFWSTPKTAILA